MVVQAQLRAVLVFFAYSPPPFSAVVFLAKLFCVLCVCMRLPVVFQQYTGLVCQGDRAGGCLRHWSSRSCNLFYDYLVYKQFCSGRSKCFHLPTVAKSLELALVISVTSLKPILSHLNARRKKCNHHN